MCFQNAGVIRWQKNNRCFCLIFMSGGRGHARCPCDRQHCLLTRTACGIDRRIQHYALETIGLIHCYLKQEWQQYFPVSFQEHATGRKVKLFVFLEMIWSSRNELRDLIIHMNWTVLRQHCSTSLCRTNFTYIYCIVRGVFKNKPNYLCSTSTCA